MLRKQTITVYLVNKAGETVVEALDLLLFVSAVYVEVWVYVQVEGGQQALVNRQGRERRGGALEVAVGAGVQGAAAHGDAAEAARSWTEAAQPTHTAAPDRVAGADSLGALQTHDGGTETEETQTRAGDSVAESRRWTRKPNGWMDRWM